MSSPIRTPKSQKLGPGVLKLGETGTEIDISCQVTSVKITWSSDSEDDIPVLCGGFMPGDETYNATLEATLVQDLSEDGVIDFTWKHRGEVMKLEFTPTTGNAKVTGSVKINPMELGGDVRKTNTSDVEFPFMGDPDFKPLTASSAV